MNILLAQPLSMTDFPLSLNITRPSCTWNVVCSIIGSQDRGDLDGIRLGVCVSTPTHLFTIAADNVSTMVRSAKAVRKRLINEGIDESYIKNYKPQIDEVVRLDGSGCDSPKSDRTFLLQIKNIYLRLSTAAGPPITPDQKPTILPASIPSNGGVKREAPTGSQTSDVKRARPNSKAKSAATVGSDGEGEPVKKKPKAKRKKRAEGEKSDAPTNNPFNKPLQLR
jgi:hypothetical protein